MSSYDVSLPISNSMWRYQPGWENDLRALSDTNNGDSDSVYRFNLCSHTGTYIETAGHKLSGQPNLSDLDISAFTRQRCDLLWVRPDTQGCITLAAFEAALGDHVQPSETLGNLILATGWSKYHSETHYLTQAPWFHAQLTDHLATLPLGILGVDTPIIDNQEQPYDPVRQMFEANRQLLLLAPLKLPPDLPSGRYLLDCAPLNITNVSAAPCRPVMTTD
ncbi:MAG: cyclase family protein [Pseudomonadota bacterium]|nr:cyclase family protein [Pseudomonadota bacterium]